MQELFQTAFQLAAIGMVEHWLRRSWQEEFKDAAKLEVILMRSAEDMRSYRDLTSDQKVTYPYAALVITNIGIDEAKGGLGKRFLPVVTGRDQKSNRVEISRQIPVRIGLGLTFRADSLDHIINLSHILHFASPRIVLRLTNDYGFLYECGLSIEPDLTIPQADMGYPSKEFRFETSLVLSAYAIRSREQGVIRNIQFTVTDSGGVSQPLGSFPELKDLVVKEYGVTDIMNRESAYYKRD